MNKYLNAMKHFFSDVEEALYNEKIQLIDREDSPDWAYNRRLCVALGRGLSEAEARAEAENAAVVYGD